MIKRYSVGLLGALLLFATPGIALSLTTINMTMGGGDPYWDDYDVFFGLGAPTAPDWMVQVAWTDNSLADDFDVHGSASYDIGSVHNSFETQNWYVFVDDNWGINSSSIISFTVMDGSTLYTSPTPEVYIPDNGDGYAYVTTRATSAVPEPATMLLFGTGLLGLAGISIRRKKK